MGEAKRRKQLDKGFGAKKTLVFAKGLQKSPQGNQQIKLALQSIEQNDILEYVHWSDDVQGHDYEHEQINPKVDSFFEKHNLPRKMFYPYAWEGLNCYFPYVYRDGWEVAKGLIFIADGMFFDYENFCYDNEDFCYDRSEMNYDDFKEAWLNEAKNYFSVREKIVRKIARKK